MAHSRIRVCFVCLGNICRSPTAEGIMRELVARAGLEARIEVSSAGTGAYHVGDLPDARSREAAAGRGIVLRSRARKFEAADFERFDYVLAMDRENLEHLERLARRTAPRGRLSLLRDFESGGSRSRDVPDPYYGGPGGFDRVFEICETSCRNLLDHIVEHHELG